jgi:hypothetical protein
MTAILLVETGKQRMGCTLVHTNEQGKRDRGGRREEWKNIGVGSSGQSNKCDDE